MHKNKDSRVCPAACTSITRCPPPSHQIPCRRPRCQRQSRAHPPPLPPLPPSPPPTRLLHRCCRCRSRRLLSRRRPPPPRSPHPCHPLPPAASASIVAASSPASPSLPPLPTLPSSPPSASPPPPPAPESRSSASHGRVHQRKNVFLVRCGDGGCRRDRVVVVGSHRRRYSDGRAAIVWVLLEEACSEW